MELETARYYEKAAKQATDASCASCSAISPSRGAEAEGTPRVVRPEPRARIRARGERRRSRTQLFVLQVVQPGLAGLMDGSVSTLAPLFASAFATQATAARRFWSGWPPRVGAGISMGFAEALSDDGSLTGRGRPLLRGVVCGLMTFLGGVGHALAVT